MIRTAPILLKYQYMPNIWQQYPRTSWWPWRARNIWYNTGHVREGKVNAQVFFFLMWHPCVSSVRLAHLQDSVWHHMNSDERQQLVDENVLEPTSQWISPWSTSFAISKPSTLRGISCKFLQYKSQLYVLKGSSGRRIAKSLFPPYAQTLLLCITFFVL